MTDVKNEKSRGRPRAFDRQQALERAMTTFWAHGYDATSLPMLTDAMGISAQSLYAAFGSKEALYREAIALYQATAGSFATRALAEEADVVTAMARLLHDAAEVFASAAGSHGCMITTAPDDMEETPLTLLGRSLRAEGVTRLAERIEQAKTAGQIRTDTDSAVLARLIAGIVQGMSVQARDGATVDQLRATATLAADMVATLRPGA